MLKCVYEEVEDVNTLIYGEVELSAASLILNTEKQNFTSVPHTMPLPEWEDDRRDEGWRDLANTWDKWQTKGFDVSSEWIAMGNEFGDILVKHRQSGKTFFIQGWGVSLSCLRISKICGVDVLMFTSNSLNIFVFHLDQDQEKISCSYWGIVAIAWQNSEKLTTISFHVDCETEETSRVYCSLGGVTVGYRDIAVSKFGGKLKLLPKETQFVDLDNFSPNTKQHLTTVIHGIRNLQDGSENLAAGSLTGCCHTRSDKKQKTYYGKEFGLGGYPSVIVNVKYNRKSYIPLLAFVESEPAVLHIVDYESEREQVISLNTESPVVGLEWNFDGTKLYVFLQDSIVLFSISGGADFELKTLCQIKANSL